VRIIGTPTSPYTRKVRVVALEKGLDVEFVDESPLAEGSRIADLNPLAKVPVFVLPDGSTLVDSPLIAEFLDRMSDRPRLIPVAGPEHFAVREWEAIADGVLDAAILVRFESLRPEPSRSSAWVERQLDKVHRGLAVLERRLGAAPFCVGPSLTLADIGTACCITYLEFRFGEIRWRERYPALGRLAAALETRPSFVATPIVA
jgi:glutathione S-transferase